VLRPKLVGYGVILTVMILLFVYASATIAPVRMDVIRDRNALYRENNRGEIENTFTIKILNKTEAKHDYQLSVEGLNNARWIGLDNVSIAAGEILTLPISVAIDPVELKRSVTNINIVVRTEIDGESVITTQETRFFGE
jgi:polyferredoxin